MASKTLLTATAATVLLSAFASAGAAGGRATIENKCDYDVFVWSVDNFNGGTPIKIPGNGGFFSETFRRPCPDCGVSLKISKSNAAPTDITQFEYSVKQDQIWYDISLIDCTQGEDAKNCPGHEAGITLGTVAKDDSNAMDGCETMYCKPGEFCPYYAYYVPVPGDYQPVRACAKGQLDGELKMVLCSDNNASESSQTSTSTLVATATSTPTSTPTPVLPQIAVGTPQGRRLKFKQGRQ